MDLARRRRLTLLTMCMSQGMILLDITIVNVALPSMQRDLDMTPGRLEWVISAYALTLATLIPFAGTLGDRLGRKRLFLIGLAIFTLASAGCALSTTDLMLIGFRVLEGIGGAVMSALTLSLLSEAYPAERRPAAIGIWAAAASVGFSAGPVVGGLLLSWASWGSIFWVNVPVGLLAFAAAWVGVSESKDPLHRPLDVVGATLCMIGLLGLTLGLIQSSSSGWGSLLVNISVIGGLAALGCFFVWEHRARQPMAPPELLQAHSFRWSCIAYLLAYATFTGVLFYVTLLFQDVKGWSALRTGLSWLVLNAPFLLVAQAAGAMHRRFSGRAVMTAGLLVAALGVFALSQVTTTTTFVLAAVGYVLVGLGFGMFAPAVSNAAMAEVPTGSSGIASAILNASRQVGTSVGLAVLGTIGAATAVSSWTGHLTGLPSSKQALSHSVKQSVAGGQIHQIGGRLGSAWIAPATASFLHGYETALAVGAVLLVVAAGATFLGLARSAARRADALGMASAPSARARSRATRRV